MPTLWDWITGRASRCFYARLILSRKGPFAGLIAVMANVMIPNQQLVGKIFSSPVEGPKRPSHLLG
jgi:hypothetical protein